MKLRPLHDRVVVRRVKEEEKTKGGIIIPDTAKEKPQEGEVVAVGAGAFGDDNERIALDVKVGDRVLFGQDVVVVAAQATGGLVNDSYSPRVLVTHQLHVGELRIVQHAVPAKKVPGQVQKHVLMHECETELV